MRLTILGVSLHQGEYEGVKYNYSKIYTVAPMEQSETKRGMAGVDMRALPEVFSSVKDVDFNTQRLFEVETQLRALGGSNVRETVVSIKPVKA